MVPRVQSTTDSSSSQDRVKDLQEQLQAVEKENTTLQAENDKLSEQVTALIASQDSQHGQNVSFATSSEQPTAVGGNKKEYPEFPYYARSEDTRNHKFRLELMGAGLSGVEADA